MHQDSRSKRETVMEVVDLFVDLGEVVWEVGVWVVQGVAGLLELG